MNLVSQDELGGVGPHVPYAVAVAAAGGLKAQALW